MPSLRLLNGLVVTPDGVLPGGLWCDEGIIGAIGDRLPSADADIDVRGAFILPGLVDPHVHLGTGGSADDAKFLEDLTTETRAAAAGGITTIVTDHENAHGPSWITTRTQRSGQPLLAAAKAAVEERSVVDVRYTANPNSAEDIADMAALVEAGVTSFKMFPSYVGAEADEFGIVTVDFAFILDALEEIARLDTPERPTQGMVHCEEPSICSMRKRRLRGSEAPTLEGWARARPAICEAMQILDVGLIAKESKARVYIPHVSSEEGVGAIRHLRGLGVDIVGESCPHYLTSRFPWQAGAFGKVNPPVRGTADCDALWHAIGEGWIEAIGSDNCRYPVAEKLAGDLWDAIPGFSEIGLSLPLLLTEGIAGGRLDWATLARITSENPARRFGMFPTKGTLRVGSDADVTIVDPEPEWTVRSAELPYEPEFSLYEGMEMRGRIVTVVRRGEVIVDGNWLAAGGGSYVENPNRSQRQGGSEQ